MITHPNVLQHVCIVLSLCALSVVMIGCKASEAKSSGFEDKSKMIHDPSMPFQRSWVKPGLDKSRYAKIYVAPVNTEYMLKLNDWEKGERFDEVKKDVAHLAVYTQTEIQKAFRQDPKHRWQIVESPTADPDALIVEVALVQVVPSKVTLNALGYAPFYIGTGITAVRMAANDTSSVAFEARIRDASTKEIVAQLADREAAQVAPVNVRGLTWYGDAERIITQWSQQFVQVGDRKAGETVKDTDTFTLSPW